MSSGERDRQVVIQQDTGATRDTDGAPIDGYTDFRTVWLSQEYVGGSEGETGEGRTATSLHRWGGLPIDLAGVTAVKMRINDGGVLYDITNVDTSRKRKGEVFLITKQRGA